MNNFISHFSIIHHSPAVSNVQIGTIFSHVLYYPLFRQNRMTKLLNALLSPPNIDSLITEKVHHDDKTKSAFVQGTCNSHYRYCFSICKAAYTLLKYKAQYARQLFKIKWLSYTLLKKYKISPRVIAALSLSCGPELVL